MMRPTQHLAGLVLASLTAAGCGSTSARDDLRARLVLLESQVAAVERRADAAVTLLERVEGLEAALALPPPGPDADVAARLAALEALTAALQERAAVLEAQAGAPAPTAAPGEPPPTLRGPPGQAAPPPEGATLEALSAGSGALLLARGPSGLVRVALLGVDAPERAEVYAQRADLRARHVAALGPAAVKDDAAFEASRAHLEGLLRGGAVSLTYGGHGGGDHSRRRGGDVAAYLTVTPPGGEPQDVNAAMLRDGFAAAAPTDHPRAVRYAELEAEARAAGRGLFERP